LSRIEEL
jgi:hypothetical protein